MVIGLHAGGGEWLVEPERVRCLVRSVEQSSTTQATNTTCAGLGMTRDFGWIMQVPNLPLMVNFAEVTAIKP